MIENPRCDEDSAVVLIGGELRSWSDWPSDAPRPSPLTDVLLEAIENYDAPRVLLIGPTASALTADLLQSSDANLHVVLRSLDDARRGALASPAAHWYAGSFPGLPAGQAFDVIALAGDLADVLGTDVPEDVVSMDAAIRVLSRWLRPRGVLLVSFPRWSSLEESVGPPAPHKALSRPPRIRGLHSSPEKMGSREGLAVVRSFDLWPCMNRPSLLTPVDRPLDASLTRAVLRGWYDVDPKRWLRDPLRFLLTQGGIVDPSVSAGALVIFARPEDREAGPHRIIESRPHGSLPRSSMEGEIVAAAIHRAILLEDLDAARGLLGRYAQWVESGTPGTAATRAMPWRTVVDSQGSFSCELTDGHAPVAAAGTAVTYALLHLATTHVGRLWPGPWVGDSPSAEVVRAFGALAGRDVTADEIATASALAVALDDTRDVGWGMRLLDCAPAREEQRDHLADLGALAAERAEQVRWLEGTIRAKDREVRSLRGALSVENSLAYRVVSSTVRLGPGLRRRGRELGDRLWKGRARGA